MNYTLHKQDFTQKIADLIQQTACMLPKDIECALVSARALEVPGNVAHSVLDTILNNVDAARKQQQPLCQDTGLPAFYIDYPCGISTRTITHCIQNAVIQATANGFLRPNAVNPLTGKNSGNNLGIMIPCFHFMEWDKPEIQIACMLKGGGSENVSIQYSLPDAELSAGRDLNGVAACVIDAVIRAQGNGCAPGIIAVGIGGNRVTGMQSAKKQLFRLLDDENEYPELDKLEKSLLTQLNKLEIGPMGLGGKTTVLGVKIGIVHRIPASYFVSVAYMCWACRRRVMNYKL